MSRSPQHGQTVVFSAVPPGSYCQPGERYRVEKRKQDSDFRFVGDNGASTYDRPWAVAMSVWSEA